jgi:hypothetical protein
MLVNNVDIVIQKYQELETNVFKLQNIFAMKEVLEEPTQFTER